MTKYILATLITLIAAPSLANDSGGGVYNLPVACNKTDIARQKLGANFSEAPVITGVTADGVLMEVWADRTKNAWTVTLTKNNATCVIAEGTDLEAIKWQSQTDPKI